MRDLFLLDPDITFLNHGSFGACPKPVFEAYQDWQRRLERQPVQFMGRDYHGLMDDARARLAAFIGAEADEVIYLPNATVAMNLVARSLDLQPGDEILTTDHEYGAIDKTWQFICQKTGAKLVHQPLTLPIESAEQISAALWAGATDKTRVVSVSHITSPTAITLPVAAICAEARQRGIISVVDGAHAVGQVPLDMAAIGADYYTSNCHKWLCAPKGSAFLYVRRQIHANTDPLVISWGWTPDAPFAEANQWQGTQDVSAYLSVPHAIDFIEAHDWPAVRQRSFEMVTDAVNCINALTGLEPITPQTREFYTQMAAVRLPQGTGWDFQKALWNDYRVEVPATQQGSDVFLRVSIQAYNTPADVDRLVAAVGDLLRQANHG